MNIAQALKQKNRLSKEYKRLLERLKTKNKRQKDSPQPQVDCHEIIIQLAKTRDELSLLKQKIVTASAPVHGKIAQLGLYKEKLAVIEALNCDDTPKKEGFSSVVITEYTVSINEAQKEALIVQSKKNIDLLQDEIDLFNAITQV